MNAPHHPVRAANDNPAPFDMTAASIAALAVCVIAGIPAVVLWLGIVWR